MRIDGCWSLCDDGVLRPVIRGAVQSSDGAWVAADFLVDPGSDCSLLAADVFAKLAFTPSEIDGLAGVGGVVTGLWVETAIRLMAQAGSPVVFHGRFAVVVGPSPDMCLIGRDILGLFAVIIDRPQNIVCMLSQRHHYVIVEQ